MKHLNRGYVTENSNICNYSTGRSLFAMVTNHFVSLFFRDLENSPRALIVLKRFVCCIT